MHEFSICESLIELINSEFIKLSINNKNVRLKEVKLQIGSLRQIIPDYLIFAYKTLTNNSNLFGSQLKISVIPIEMSCNNCGYKGILLNKNYDCPECHSKSIELLNGKELFVESIEIEEN
jgi:hydrogenase nickel incorporation protein HypA/HybF